MTRTRIASRIHVAAAFAVAFTSAAHAQGTSPAHMPPAAAQDRTQHGVVPLHKLPPEQWVEKVWGDADIPGVPFVIRIHNDAGYVVLPHTHPEDENIAIVQGSWSLGMGRTFNRSALVAMGVGDFGFVRKTMAHFGYAKSETIVQVHGIGPFENRVVDPLYQLTDKGVLLKPSLVKPGVATSSSPPDCFLLKVGARVRSDAGEGIVVGALCSPANQLTQYWIQKPNGGRYWAIRHDLTPL